MKYELTSNYIEQFTIRGEKEVVIKLYQIQALESFADVKEGDLGGYIESEENLSQKGNCWVYDDARVYDNARVYDDALVYGNAKVYGYAKVYGNAKVYGYAWIYGDACVFGYALVLGGALVFGGAKVYGNALVYGNAWVHGDARVYGDAYVGDDWVCGDAAEISSDKDIIWLSNIGSQLDTITIYRTKNKGLIVSYANSTNTIEKFELRVKSKYGDSKDGREFLALIEFAKIHFDYELKEIEE